MLIFLFIYCDLCLISTVQGADSGGNKVLEDVCITVVMFACVWGCVCFQQDLSPGSIEEAEEAEPDDEFKDAIEVKTNLSLIFEDPVPSPAEPVIPQSVMTGGKNLPGQSHFQIIPRHRTEHFWLELKRHPST